MELIFERREIDKEEMRGRLQKMKMQKINKKNKVEISKKCSEGNREERKRETKKERREMDRPLWTRWSEKTFL